VLSIGALLLPVGHAWLWVLPALALVAATLAGSTWVSPLAAASVAAAAWCAVLTTSRVYASGRGEFAVRLAAFRPAGQLLAATVALIATAVFLARTPRFDEPIRRIQP
jgi:hypothetical protein